MSHLAPSGKWDARYVRWCLFFPLCMLGGVLACGMTHAGITLDVAKCNMQGLTSGLATLVREEGQTGIWKYGLYEVFKDAYITLAGEEIANKYKPAIRLAGSASAEVKIQTSPSGTFPTAFGAALREMQKNKIDTRYPIGSLVPLWSRQFFFFEKIVQLFYTHLGVTFVSGYLAGVVCAIVSHPADSIVSLIGKPANKGKSIVALATKGLGTRVIMISTLTGFQWWIYATFKVTMGLGTTGGK
ncbi:hypothetical protein V8E55_011927 [Tylopilus felleus]